MTKEEFGNMYRKYYAQMYRTAFSMLYDADESKDVVSDVFARLLKGTNMPEPDKIENYLMVSVKNQCHNIISHKTIRERVEKLFSLDTSQNIVVPADDDRLERLIQFVDAEFSPLSKQIFKLRFLQEMTYEEISKVCGISKVTVYNHLSQSLKQIKDYFKTSKNNI